MNTCVMEYPASPLIETQELERRIGRQKRLRALVVRGTQRSDRATKALLAQHREMESSGSIGNTTSGDCVLGIQGTRNSMIVLKAHRRIQHWEMTLELHRT